MSQGKLVTGKDQISPRCLLAELCLIGLSTVSCYCKGAAGIKGSDPTLWTHCEQESFPLQPGLFQFLTQANQGCSFSAPFNALQNIVKWAGQAERIKGYWPSLRGPRFLPTWLFHLCVLWKSFTSLWASVFWTDGSLGQCFLLAGRIQSRVAGFKKKS